jgi:hypothetical protein
MSLVLKNARPPVSSATSLSVSTMVSTVESVVNCCVLAAGGDAKAPTNRSQANVGVADSVPDSFVAAIRLNTLRPREQLWIEPGVDDARVEHVLGRGQLIRCAGLEPSQRSNQRVGIGREVVQHVDRIGIVENVEADVIAGANFGQNVKA